MGDLGTVPTNSLDKYKLTKFDKFIQYTLMGKINMDSRLKRQLAKTRINPKHKTLKSDIPKSPFK